jgi:ferritin
MSGHSGPARFHQLFESALQHYEKTTNIILAEHPLAEQLQNYHSVESITTFFQDHARKFGDFSGIDRIMKSIENIVSVLCMLSATAALGDSVHLVMS